jgi:hypothetical protein
VWDWQAARWTLSPLLTTVADAQDWQRAANRLAEGPAEGDPRGKEKAESGEADESEKLFWWAFCYVALGFVGVALALFASDIAG